MFYVRRAICPLSLANTRHGYMVDLPGNLYGKHPKVIAYQKYTPDPDTRRRKRKVRNAPPKKHKKGTQGLRLDTIVPGPELMHKKTDPIKTCYAYQVPAYPRTRSSDPIPPFCALTKTAIPTNLDNIKLDENCISDECLDRFVDHTEGCIDVFNSVYRQKGLVNNPTTPLELDEFSKQYSSSFLHGLINFLYKDQSAGAHLTTNSHLTFNQNTGTFWRVPRLLPVEGKLKMVNPCNGFQLMNYIDLMMRTTKPISYDSLGSGVFDEPEKITSVARTCTQELHYFKQVGQIYQYPGFIRETLYPYNHTLFKVVSPDLSNYDMHSVALITGFGQTYSTMQHRLDFTCHVDVIPPVSRPEATNVVVTDGNRYCLGVYQCNTTDTVTEESARTPNQCAIAPPRPLLAYGQVNRELLSDLLTLLTYDKDACSVRLLNSGIEDSVSDNRLLNSGIEEEEAVN